MARVIATAADAGRFCPYCRFPLKEGSAAERCSSCSSLQHEDCWHDGGGCAMLGCPEAGRGAAAAAVAGAGAGAGAGAPWPGSAHPQEAYAGAQPPPGYPNYATLPGYPPPPLVQPRSGNNNALIIATLIALIGIGTGAVLATGALSSGGAKHPSTPAALQPAPLPKSPLPKSPVPSGPTPSERVRGRHAIMGILATYQRAYSDRDTSGLASIFTPAIKRHGLAAGGCSVSTGRGAVLADYRSQFEEGSGSYELVGLSQWQISFDSKTKAHIDTHYRIADSSVGFVNFRFTNSGEGWRMSEVYATCA